MKLPISAMMCLFLHTAAAGLASAQTTVPAAQTARAGVEPAENVAVIINESSHESQRVGDYYLQQRAIPAANIIRITTTTEDVIERAAYVRTIEDPIAAALARGQLQDRILYLVLTKGLPLRIAGTTGQEGTGASVDSELTLLYRRMVGQTVLTRGRINNPYYLGERAIREARPFTHRDHDTFLVSRLDAFTVEDTFALIDRAKASTTTGRIVLDQIGGLTNRLGDTWLAAAADGLSAAGHGDRVLLEGTAKAVRGEAGILGYFSWGSTDPQNRVRTLGMEFVPGAIASSFGSTDARTFREPPVSWLPTGASNNRATWFGGSSQSLVGDLIREGVTGVAGYVSEPYFQSVVRPEILFAAYLSGHNLIESFYLATPHLGWQTVVIGDPLCAPFSRQGADGKDLNPPVDSSTELPLFFSARRLAQLAAAAPAMPQEALALWARSHALRGRGDEAGALGSLEGVVERAPAVAAPRLELALLLEQGGEVHRAVEQYRRILEVQPNQVVALNNLAYALAVGQNAPAEGLPFAKRAATLTPANANVLDTLAWIEHLLGDHDTAAKRLEEAIRRDPNHADIRLHAAIVFQAAGARVRAEAELKTALRLNPSLEDSESVRHLRAKLAIP